MVARKCILHKCPQCTQKTYQKPSVVEINDYLMWAAAGHTTDRLWIIREFAVQYGKRKPFTDEISLSDTKKKTISYFDSVPYECRMRKRSLFVFNVLVRTVFKKRLKK